MARRLKRSESIALACMACAVIGVGAFDLFIWNIGLWPSIILGCLLAGGLYRAFLDLTAKETIIDRL